MSDNPLQKTTSTTPSRQIVQHYEACLEQHGDTHLGVDWPKAEDVDKRYAVMLDVFQRDLPSIERAVSLLDFGCGASHLYEYMQRTGVRGVEYSGLDLSPKFIALSRSKFPSVTYYCLDVLQSGETLPKFDYVVMNGVLTEKRDVPFDSMMAYTKDLLRAAFRIARRGIAFNVMTKHVDWERDDLFHVPFDELAAFATKELSRHLVFRSDYGLYEYTTYIYRESTSWLK